MKFAVGGVVVASLAAFAVMKGEDVQKMVGLAAAAGGVGALLKALQHMETMMGMMQTLVEKCTYMEQRMDKGAGKLSDCCRHLQQTFEAFEVPLNPGGNLK